MILASVSFRAATQGSSYRNFVRKVLAILQREYSQTLHIVFVVYFPEYFGRDSNHLGPSQLTKEDMQKAARAKAVTAD